ncbi:hypothetical protein LNP17_01185 [Klebsiella variicola subsp. variicola]|nr:hypothetical protein [Klebsiella variicola subsp. variicola]
MRADPDCRSILIDALLTENQISGTIDVDAQPFFSGEPAKIICYGRLALARNFAE